MPGLAIPTSNVKPLATPWPKRPQHFIYSRRSVYSRRSGQSRRSSNSLPSIYLARDVVRNKPKKKLSIWSTINIIRRLTVIAAAIQYIYISMLATQRMTEVLSGAPSSTTSFGVFTTSLIASYTGEGLIYDGPLVQELLEGDTTPRDYAIFLESETKTSTENCSAIPGFNPAIYNHNFLSNVYQEMVDDAQYSIRFLSELELVVVVVDCTFTQLVNGDPSMVRVFNVVRSLSDSTDLYLVGISLSVQDYEIPHHKKYGPATIAILTFIQDMSEASVEQYYLVATTYPYQRSLDFEAYEFVGITEDSFLELNSIPRDPETEPVKNLFTARKRGFYDSQDQSNIYYTYSLLNMDDATSALTKSEWLGEAVLLDAWAWVHGIHLFFGMQTIFSLMVVCLVSYQNFRQGKLWVGDPFASVSTASLILRGVLVVISWHLNSFWTLNEFAVSNAGTISGTQTVPVHKELVHADVLVVYLSLVGVLSIILRERIDPSVAIFLFEIIHKHRLSFIQASPAVLKEVETYSDSFFKLGMTEMTPYLAEMSPLWLWTAFQIPEKDGTFLAASFFPKIFLLSLIAFYVVMRKTYRHVYPDQTQRRRSSPVMDQSGAAKYGTIVKSAVTHFEISTGAELQTRFGLVSDYNNYVFFKGMKFASADGVYCSGYVIANGKFLVSSKDLLTILLIKVLRTRFKNVYVYEVDGNSVKDTARLVYPHTFMWSDLWRLNLSVLL